MDGDRDKGKALIAEMMKLITNSSYGWMITNKEMHHDIVYVDESETSTEIIDNHFYDMTELPDGYYEVEKTKKKINLDLPIHIGVFILNYAKLRMLKFYYDFLDYYLSRDDFQIMDVDTDSNYLGITAENVEDLIKLELEEQFEGEQHNYSANLVNWDLAIFANFANSANLANWVLAIFANFTNSANLANWALAIFINFANSANFTNFAIPKSENI